MNIEKIGTVLFIATIIVITIGCVLLEAGVEWIQ